MISLASTAGIVRMSGNGISSFSRIAPNLSLLAVRILLIL